MPKFIKDSPEVNRLLELVSHQLMKGRVQLVVPRDFPKVRQALVCESHRHLSQQPDVLFLGSVSLSNWFFSQISFLWVGFRVL